jgi:acylglycerol lipase
MAAALARLACCVLALALASCAGMRVKTVKPTLGETNWASHDGKVMPWKAGKPVPGKVQAVVITVHGLSGAAMDFWMLEDGWPPRGIAVYGLQLRGMGNDPVKRARGDIKSASLWEKDLLTFHQLVRERHPHVPIFWYAESLGSLIALHTVVGLMGDAPADAKPAGLVFSSPAAGLRLRPKGLRASALYTMIAVMPWMRVNLEQLGGVNDKDIRVTHDTTHGAQMAITSHYVSHFSLRLLGEVDKMMRAAPEAASHLTVPVLVLASPNDVIASEEQVADFFDRIRSKDKTIRWYRKSYHLLLHDAEREEVLRDATRWVGRRVTGDQ